MTREKWMNWVDLFRIRLEASEEHLSRVDLSYKRRAEERDMVRKTDPNHQNLWMSQIMGLKQMWLHLKALEIQKWSGKEHHSAI